MTVKEKTKQLETDNAALEKKRQNLLVNAVASNIVIDKLLEILKKYNIAVKISGIRKESVIQAKEILKKIS